MDEKQFKNSVKQLKRIHKITSISLTIATICFICAPVSQLWAEEGTPYELKSILLLFAIGNIPLLYWLYNKNVVETKQSQTERQANFLKWSTIRLYVWAIDVLLCLLMYHFDSEGLTSKINSSFYLTIFCLAVIVVLGRINENDLKEQQ